MTSVSLNAEPVAPVETAVIVDHALAPAPRSAVTVIDDRNAMVKDSAGRMIKVKRLSALDRVRLFRAMGATDSENRMLQSYAATAAAVTEIDGRAVVFPQSSVQLDALIQRLDEHGLASAIEGLLALAPKGDDVATEARGF
jgi:hypothetical protein